MNVLLILGNQLFDPILFKEKYELPKISIFMREDIELCTYFKFHKQKILFFLSAMRMYKKELEDLKYQVHYEELNFQEKFNFEESFKNYLEKNNVKTLYVFEIEDKFFEARIKTLAKKLKIELFVLGSPMFLTSRTQFQTYLKNTKRPFMKTFYEGQRKRLKILIDKESKPMGGSWSFDSENRKALPKNLQPPSLPKVLNEQVSLEVCELVEKQFSSHPGEIKNVWLPTNREGARNWLKIFLKERLEFFGPYEDAIPAHSNTLFHSVLTPFLNTGLLSPKEIVRETLRFSKKNKVPLTSQEGFIRQVIGWREFIRGIYQNFDEQQFKNNFWNHHNKLTDVWYKGGSGIPALDRAIERVNKTGYLHHIERLMVVGNLMLLLEVHPHEAYRWFMEMFVDSSDWVMGPNVFGMALYSDGGLFATKPYICGSNYLRKMSGDPKDEWCDGVDGLYWGFIEIHKNFFLKNPRLSMMARNVEKMDPERIKILKNAANELKQNLVMI